MIAPHKYLNLELSVLNIGGLVLRILTSSQIIKYEDLLERIIKVKGEEAKEMFLPTLNFLFLLGKLKYHKEIDSIEITL